MGIAGQHFIKGFWGTCFARHVDALVAQLKTDTLQEEITETETALPAVGNNRNVSPGAYANWLSRRFLVT